MKKPQTIDWESLVNDGENYGDTTGKLSPQEKIIFEAIKDNTVLKIQDSFLFTQKKLATAEHGKELATLIAHFEPIKKIKTLILTHNHLSPEGAKILTESPYLPKITYLHLGSNHLGDEGVKLIAQSEIFSEVKLLNLECNGITAEGAIALARSPVFSKLTSLNMVDNRVGDEGALAIADSDTLRNLTYLHLGGNRIKTDEAKKALKESKKLTQLETLKVF
jgi:hypothetical protein